MKLNIIIGMTSIPDREDCAVETIKSILNQSLLPDKIILTICNTYERFPNKKYNVNYIKKNIDNPLLKIHYSDVDYGPISKLFGTMDEISIFEQNTFIILIDDDLIYKPYMLQTFYNNIIKDSSNAYSFLTHYNKANNCYVGQGSTGFVLNVDILDDIKRYYHDCILYDKRLYYQDDLIISTYLSYKKCKVIYVPPFELDIPSFNLFIWRHDTATQAHPLRCLTNELSRQNLNNISIPSSLNPNVNYIGDSKVHIDYLHCLQYDDFEPSVIFDIGAGNKTWTQLAIQVWPSATFVLFEIYNGAEKLYKKFDNYVGALGETDRKIVKFDDHNMVLYKSCRTLDALAAKVYQPSLIRFNSHCYNLSILKGGMNTISKCKYIIVNSHDQQNDSDYSDETIFLKQLGFNRILSSFDNNEFDNYHSFVFVNVNVK